MSTVISARTTMEHTDEIQFACPQCGKRLRTKADLAGKRVKCPSCGQVIVVLAACPTSQPKATSPSAAKPPAASKGRPMAAPSPVPESKPVPWLWYAGGGLAALCLVTVVVFIAVPGKTRSLTKGGPVAGLYPEAHSPEKRRNDPGQNVEGAGESKPRQDEQKKKQATPSIDPKTEGRPEPKPEESGPLSIARDQERLVLKYTVGQLEKLKPGEWPALFVFLSRANGPILDEKIIKAKERRAGVLGQVVSSGQAMVFFSQIAAEGSPDLAGYRLTIYDTDAKKIRKGAELIIPFGILDNLTKSDPFGGFWSKPSLDWAWLGAEVSLSAALVACKTEKGDYVVQRFLGKVATQRVKPKG